MIFYSALNEILENVKETNNKVDEKTLSQLTTMIREVDHVFVMGMGRSGLVAKAFAMRLMHLGLGVYVVGETITPAITDKDCLIAISGSGETSYIISTTETAKERGAKIVAITSYTDSPLAKKSDLVVQLKGRTKKESENNFIGRQMSGEHTTFSPLGTLFEITALIFLDSTIAQLMSDLEVTEDVLRDNHTVLE
ncbi:MAG: 6-phospho 3-hexuloisomerase [Methanosphaera sp. rholeuAM74]|nr:MAG: 6-phospho 3-hexuloisomerase [Methanosphaera sp. rholeuAM74]